MLETVGETPSGYRVIDANGSQASRRYMGIGGSKYPHQVGCAVLPPSGFTYTHWLATVSRPAIEAKDAIGVGDSMPALDIA
jgi:hypothetical protein